MKSLDEFEGTSIGENSGNGENPDIVIEQFKAEMDYEKRKLIIIPRQKLCITLTLTVEVTGDDAYDIKDVPYGNALLLVH